VPTLPFQLRMNMKERIPDPDASPSAKAGAANAVADWARGQTDIRGLALIGSHARGEARPDSDIDFMALALDPKTFEMDIAWPKAIASPGMRIVKWEDERYGVVWSRRLWFESSCEVELSFGTLTGAALNPIAAERDMSSWAAFVFSTTGWLDDGPLGRVPMPPVVN
jgi:Nucleotidyltransferase domain